MTIRDYNPAPPELRRAALERDGYACRDCGLRGTSGTKQGQLNVHHQDPYRAGGEHDLDNLVTLCRECHRKHDREHVLKLGRETRARNKEQRAEELQELLADNPFMTPQEVADLFGVTKRTVQLWVKSGKLPVLRIGRTVRIKRDDLLAMTQKPKAA